MTITSHALFQRTFGQHIFEVEAADKPNTFITKHSYHSSNVYYDFHFNRQNQRLTIQERHQTGEVLELIPHQYFESEFAEEFVINYSHWMNRRKNHILFRPISFQDTQFLTNVPYVLIREKGFFLLRNRKRTQCLVNSSSLLFQNLFQRYFRRLDNEPYVYMFANDSMLTDFVIDIYLPRLGLAFKFDISRRKIFSREYSGMCIDENQCFGTLTGLTAGLLLSPVAVSNGDNLSRKFIVPFGEIKVKNMSDNVHQTVFIERTSSVEFPHQYFVFILNDRLRILQSSDSPTGWLYLALLHAMTSNPLPDFYTGMTGMERAFQLLNCAGCWTDQPYDSLSLKIAKQIAEISPKVNYHPIHLTLMEDIQWSQQGLPYSLQHFGYYLIINKLIHASEQLKFLYSSSDSKT